MRRNTTTPLARVSILVATVCVSLIGLIGSVSAHPGGKTIHVHHGHSIQSAINAAHPYDRIVVEAGTYAEQLTISKDGIALIGHKAILVPPTSPTTNDCSGLAGPNFFTKLDTQAGICITGSDVKLETFSSEHRKFKSVGRRVRDVSVSGFSISGFDGLNIAIVGAKDAYACSNTLTDGATYGALTLGSKNSVIERNTVVSNPPIAPNTFLRFIGICMDDVSTVTVAYNSIDGYIIGLCVQTSNANVHDNLVKNSCIGAFVDPGVNGARLIDNVIKDTNPLCKESADVSGAFGVWGIAISGSTNTLVKGNRISGITDGFAQDKLPAAGVAVLDEFPGGKDRIASGNTVVHNTIKKNDVDVYVDSKGTGNVVKDDGCKTSFPTGLCK
jgi:hypothetical protein